MCRISQKITCIFVRVITSLVSNFKNGSYWRVYRFRLCVFVWVVVERVVTHNLSIFVSEIPAVRRNIIPRSVCTEPRTSKNTQLNVSNENDKIQGKPQCVKLKDLRRFATRILLEKVLFSRGWPTRHSSFGVGTHAKPINEKGLLF